MASYLARVELHSATYQDYEKLHGFMQNRGFTRTIKGDDGFTYRLPTGTYVAVNASASLDTALRAATEAAAETGRTFSAIVADWNSARWQGLERQG